MCVPRCRECWVRQEMARRDRSAAQRDVIYVDWKRYTVDRFIFLIPPSAGGAWLLYPWDYSERLRSSLPFEDPRTPRFGAPLVMSQSSANYDLGHEE
jgi:hypothetical protein